MKDADKTKEELIGELAALRRRVSALEGSVEKCRRIEAELRDELAARKLAEVEIRRNQALLSQVAANIPGVVYQILQKKDGSQHFPYISEGSYALYGLSPEEIQADSARLFALIPPEDADRVQQTIRESTRLMAEYRLDHRVWKPDGAVVWLRVRSTPQRLPNGDILWNGVAIDITEQKQLEEALGESESRFRSLFENAGISLWEEDFSEVKDYIDQLRATGIKDVGRFFEHHWQAVVLCASKVQILDVNEAGLKLYKARQKEQLLKSLKEVLTQESIFGFKAELISLAEGNLSSQVMSVNRDLQGNRLEVMVKWTVLPGYEDSWSRVLVSIVDVTDLKQTENSLHQNQLELAAIFESTPIMMLLLDQDKRVRKINQATLQIINRRAEETIGLRGGEALRCLNALDDPRGCGFGPACKSCAVRRTVLDTFRTGQSHYRVEATLPLALDEQPEERNLALSTALVDGLKSQMTLVCVEDITEHKRTEAQIKASLQEKEVLLKEIHHRVKNNLTIVSSLLELQADTIEDEQARAAFRESQVRVYSMAHIHEHLYRSQDLAWIDMPQYIQSLSEYLRLTYQTNGIRLVSEVADVALDMDRAVPCGLIINELVSNALKHAFPPGRNGRSQDDEIQIRLWSEDEKNVQLVVSDNGVGFPPETGRQNGASLGLELVKRLTRQLRGKLERNSTSNGASFKLTFAKPTTLYEEVKL